jgi:hypothetical protein
VRSSFFRLHLQERLFPGTALPKILSSDIDLIFTNDEDTAGGGCATSFTYCSLPAAVVVVADAGGFFTHLSNQLTISYNVCSVDSRAR